MDEWMNGWIDGCTHVLIALLLPLRNQHRVRVPVFQQPVVKLPPDGLLLIVQVVDVAAALMGDLEDLPLRLVLCARQRLLVLRVLHLVAEDDEIGLDIAEALWGRLALAAVTDRRHRAKQGKAGVEVKGLRCGALLDPIRGAMSED